MNFRTVNWGECFEQDTPSHIAMRIVKMEECLVEELTEDSAEILVEPDWVSRILLLRRLQDVERIRKGVKQLLILWADREIAEKREREFMESVLDGGEELKEEVEIGKKDMDMARAET